MKQIIVGSQNAAKIAAVTQAAEAYWPTGVTITSADIPSGVPAMPLTHDDMIAGARNRALGALGLQKNAALGIGLEGGVADIAGSPVMMGYVAITDGRRTVIVPTAGTPLPASWAQAMAEGAELRPFVIAAGLPYDYTQGVVGLLTRGVVPRDAGFGQAVKTALVPWVNSGIFDETTVPTVETV